MVPVAVSVVASPANPALTGALSVSFVSYVVVVEQRNEEGALHQPRRKRERAARLGVVGIRRRGTRYGRPRHLHRFAALGVEGSR
jgi:hypothetical protein